MDFKCYHCGTELSEFKKIIQHNTDAHADEELKIRFLSVNDATGKRTYVRQDFGVVPSDLTKQGKIVIGTDNRKIVILSKNEATSSNCEEPSESESCCSHKDNLQRVHDLLPEVLPKLQENGQLETYILFHELVASGVFPLDNIAFKLFMDVVRFLSVPVSSTMRYSNDVKLFWRTGYKLFHGKFLRFMGGPKHMGQVVEGTSVDTGRLEPQDAKINFAVPSAKHLETSSIIQGEMKPGILQECLKTVASHATQVKVSFDGKKINSSLSGSHGDVNLFKCEDSPTYSQLEERKVQELQCLEKMTQRAEEGTLSPSEVQSAVKMISLRIKELREVACFKAEGVRKFKSLGQPDWRSSKYVFVVSALQSALFELRATIKNCLDTNDKLCQIAAQMHGVDTMYCSGSTTTDLGQQPNYVCVVDKASKHHEEITETPNLTRCIMKQRSLSWHEVRSSGKVTGSSAHRSLGLDTFKQQVSYYDQKFNGKDPPEPSELLKSQLEYGTQNEINAVATLVGKVLPAYYPHLSYVEEGCFVMKEDGRNFMIVSPDGSGRTDPCQPASLAFEFKCPFSEKRFVPQVHYKVPHYYVVQLLCEMTALQCTSMLFLSYTPESTTIFRVLYSETLWKRIWEALRLLYGAELPKRPSKLSKYVPALKEELKAFVSENTEFLGEIPSLMGRECKHDPSGGGVPSFQSHSQSTHMQRSAEDGLQVQGETLHKAQVCVNESFNLCRRRASEIFVFMMSDLHRRSRPGSIPSIPVAYGLQGPSLNTQTVRRMLLKVLASADHENLDVISFSCDGQFIKLVTRDLDDRPLTLLQCQKSFYERVKKMPKQSLLKHFSDLNLKCEGMEQRGMRVASMADVAIKRRHLKLMSEKRLVPKMAREEESDSTSSAASILPENLGEKLDECTYQEVLSVVKALMSDKEKDKSLEEDETDISPEEVDMSHECTTKEVRFQPGIEEHQTLPTIALDKCSLQTMLSALQSEEQMKDRDKWRTMDEKCLEEMLMTGQDLDKTMSKTEVKVCVKTIKQMFPQETRHIRLASPKWMLIRDLLQLLGLGTVAPRNRRSLKCCSLKELSLKEARKLPKALLSAIYAEMVYPEEERHWRESFPYSSYSTVNDEHSLSWFSFPDTRTQENGCRLPLLGIIDSHHILTNLRTKCCKTGLPESGIHREAWVRVASANRENKIGLTLAHVDDLIDQQRNSFAQLTFSQPVEEEMRKNNDHAEADFCRLIRNWYKADDDAGVDCHVRLGWRLTLRSWLLLRYNPFHFPPPGNYVGGIPSVTYEALLTNIERKVQIYCFTEGGSFNTRSLTTLDAENFFSVLGDLAPGGSALAIRPAEIPGAMKTACELSILQADETRPFLMHTSKAPVYPRLEMCRSVGDEVISTAVSEGTDLNDMAVITTKNHEFDMISRGRTLGKRKSSSVSQPYQPSKGARGVRQHHKVDESKILPHVRLGIKCDD